MSEPLDSLVAGWKRHFAAADQTIRWGGASERLELELAPGIWLAGELDAWGTNSAGELFFGEWKTANPREKKTWKQVWRMNPQSLSYGVLAAARWPGMQRFTVRKAFKEQVPTYDHAWFRYELPELDHWRGELIRVAQEIQGYQDSNALEETVPPWPTNFSRCFRYGVKYVCPFFDVSCNRQQWQAISAAWTTVISPQRTAIMTREPNAIVLSPTSVQDWLDCRELYRRKYVEHIMPPKNDAIQLGGQFHDELSKYYAAMVPKEAVHGNS